MQCNQRQFPTQASFDNKLYQSVKLLLEVRLLLCFIVSSKTEMISHCYEQRLLQLHEMLLTAKEVLEAYKNVFDGKALSNTDES